MAVLTQEELNERIAVLKRFRRLLEKERDKFREYLIVLEKQQDSIVAEDAAALLAHTELEQQVVANITDLRKVIVPVNALYRDLHGKQDDVSDVEKLQQDLSNLQTEVLAQNEKNRDLLRNHISRIRTQLQSLRNPYTAKRSVYAEKTAVGSFIEIEALLCLSRESGCTTAQVKEFYHEYIRYRQHDRPADQ